MNLSVVQATNNDYRNTNLLLNKNNISISIIQFNCPLNMAVVGRLVPGGLAWTLIAKSTPAKPR